MATIAAKAARRAHVNTRLTELSEQLASTFDIEIPPVPGTTRDPELDQIIALERIASIFENVLNGSAQQDGAEGENIVELNAKPDFLNMPREDLDRIATEWYGIDTAEYADDEELRLVLDDAYDKAHQDEAGGAVDDPDGQEEGLPTVDDLKAMKRADLDDVAPQFGIDPSEHSKVDDLRAALIAASEPSEGKD